MQSITVGTGASAQTFEYRNGSSELPTPVQSVDLTHLFRVEMRTLDELSLVPLNTLAADILNRMMHNGSLVMVSRGLAAGGTHEERLQHMMRLAIQRRYERPTLSADGSLYRERTLSPEVYRKVVDLLKAEDTASAARGDAAYRKAKAALKAKNKRKST